MRRRLGLLGLRSLGATVGKSVLATLVMVEIGLLVRAVRLPWETMALPNGGTSLRFRVLTALVKLPLVVGASAAVYFAIARFFSMAELQDVPLLGRFFRNIKGND